MANQQQSQVQRGWERFAHQPFHHTDAVLGQRQGSMGYEITEPRPKQTLITFSHVIHPSEVSVKSATSEEKCRGYKCVPPPFSLLLALCVILHQSSLFEVCSL